MPDDQPHPLLRRELLRRGLVTAGAVAFGPRVLEALAVGAQGDIGAPVLAAANVPPPPIVTRAEWGADEAIRTVSRDFAPLSKGVVHHTVTQNRDPDPRARVRGIYEFHVRGNGWSDIGYNFVVDEAGVVYEGRWARDYAPGEPHSGENAAGLGVIGAHAASHNTGSFGIALLGTFTSDIVTATEAALASVVRIAAWKFASRTIDPFGSTPFRRADGVVETFPNLCGHRDIVSTGCPGSGLYKRLPEVRTRVSELIRRGLVGHRVLGADGSITRFGGGLDIGDLPRQNLRVPVRAAASTPSGEGVWVVSAEGGIFTFGDAPFLGSMGGVRLNQPIVGMTAHPGGNGYWLVARDGGMFTFGTARFWGSTGAIALNQPIVGMTAHPGGNGYWLVARDGGIFTFGEARFYGSTGAIRLAQPVVGMAATTSGRGYWLVAADGGVFSFGDALFYGSGVGRAGFTGPARSIAAAPGGAGYWILDSAGTVHPFGDAPTFGSTVPASARPALALLPVVRP